MRKFKIRRYKISGYLRVLFVGLPFGIGSLIVGIPMLKDTPKIADDLELHEGQVTDFGATTYYSKDLDIHRDVFFIKIDKEKFYTDRGKERNIIEQPNYNIGDKICIWTKLDKVYIKQLQLNDKMIMEYKPPYWQAWFFIIAGIIFTLMSIYYLFAYSSDLFGDN